MFGRERRGLGSGVDLGTLFLENFQKGDCDDPLRYRVKTAAVAPLPRGRRRSSAMTGAFSLLV
jgi:hypothetical protein